MIKHVVMWKFKPGTNEQMNICRLLKTSTAK